MSGKICPSADKVLENFLSSCGHENSHRRMVEQQVKCGYGLSGVCCKLCSNGPCRISQARPKGVCGADADTIAARNFLRSVAAGSGCYIHVVENTAKRLKELARSKGKIKGPRMLHQLCQELQISGSDDWDKAEHLADAVLADLRRPYDEPMVLTKLLAYGKRLDVWQHLGILPGGAKDEVFNATVKTSTNLNSDPVDMLMQCLRLGISTGLYGLVLTNVLNDVIMGEPEIGFDPVGIRDIHPEYINIMVTGHQQSMFAGLTEYLQKPEIEILARSVGAKGIKLIGCTCVGQDFQVRSCQYKDVFCGHAGNNYTSEAVVTTGCVDLIVSEFNCTIPGLEPLCEEQGIPLLCLDDVAKKKTAAYIPYTAEEQDNISCRIIAEAMTSYAKRVGPAGRTNSMAHHGWDEAVTGVTEVSLEKLLGGSYEPLIKAIADGTIKGVAAVVGCSNLRAQGHDVLTVEMVRELIKKDILVLSAGCTCGGLQNTGLMSREAANWAGPGLKALCQTLGIPPVLNFGPCLAIGRIETVSTAIAKTLNVDIPQLPVVVSAPQWLEEQALADGCFALALGFTLHLGLAPFVTGSPVIVDVLTNKLEGLTGGKLLLDTESKSSADAIESVIMEKRKGLGL